HQANQFRRLRPAPQRLDEAAQLIRLGHALNQLGPANDAELLEIGARGRDRVERVRFLPKLAEGDAHHLPSRAKSASASSSRCKTSSTSAGVIAAQKPWWQAAPP